MRCSVVAVSLLLLARALPAEASTLGLRPSATQKPKVPHAKNDNSLVGEGREKQSGQHKHATRGEEEMPQAEMEFRWSFYHITLPPLLAVTILLMWFTCPVTSETIPPAFHSFKWKFLPVWCVAVSADWLQGPYVYALYAAYGYAPSDIAKLFVAGFGSSMIFGCFVGSVADTYGRKKCAIVYCFTYALACATKHSSTYEMLMFGRILGGISTSILFTVFESWMVSENIQRYGFSESLLSYMFGLMYTIMYGAAIVSGLLAQMVADLAPMQPIGSTIYWGGNITPFDASAVLLMITAVLIWYLWEENYGDKLQSQTLSQSWSQMTTIFRQSGNPWLLMVAISAFEGSMYAFVFNWTRALHSESLPCPHGMVFGLFMMACACGASFAGIMPRFGLKSSSSLLVANAIGALSMLMVSAKMSLKQVGMPDEDNVQPIFFTFLVFEFCVGLYFPSMGTLKSEVIPEEARVATYNMLRVPLNAVVVILLMTNLNLVGCFIFCCALLATAFCAIAIVEQWKPQDTRQKCKKSSHGGLRAKGKMQAEALSEALAGTLAGHCENEPAGLGITRATAGRRVGGQLAE